jgi:trigger factor
MEATTHEATGTRRDLDVTLGKAELEPYVNKILRETQKNYQRPGFRKGHVPISVIRQLHGQAIEADAIEQAVQGEFARIVREQELRPIGTPSVTRIERTDDGGISFTVSYEILPEFELGEYKGTSVTRLYHIVSEDEINAEIENLRERQMTTEPAETADGDDSLVTIDLHKIEDGNVTEEPSGKDLKIYFRRNDINPALKDALHGAKVGDTRNVDLPTGEDQSMISYEARVTAVEKVILPEVSDEFAKQVTNDPESTSRDLIDLIKQELEAQYERRYSSAMRDDIVGKLIEAHDFPVPEVVVADVLNAMVEDNKRGQQRELPAGFDRAKFEEEMRPLAERTAKWMLIRDRIIEAEQLTADEIDYEGLAQVESMRTGIDQAMLLKYFKSQPSTAERILAEKVLQLLEDYAVVQEIEDFDAAAAEESSATESSETGKE